VSDWVVNLTASYAKDIIFGRKTTVDGKLAKTMVDDKKSRLLRLMAS
jgi:hypothetical protein